MSYYPEFSKLIEDSLLEKDRSTAWLARQLSVSGATANRWLNHGARPGSTELVVRIADILDIGKHDLLHASGYGYTILNTNTQDDYSKFAELLDEKLVEQERSPIWLARRLEIHSSTVARWLSNRTRPDSVEMVVRIADILGIDKGNLLSAAGYGYVEISNQPNIDEVAENVTQGICIQTLTTYGGDININLELGSDGHNERLPTLIHNITANDGDININIVQPTEKQHQKNIDDVIDKTKEPEQVVQLYLFDRTSNYIDENRYVEPVAQLTETINVIS